MHIDARAVAYAQTLAPRAWQYHAKDRAKDLGQDQVQKYHAQDHANYKDHPEQDPAQLQKRAYGAQIHAQAHAQIHAHAVLRPNPERPGAPKLGGFTKAKEAIKRIWRKVTGKN